jgi:hypothetical protein
MSSTLVAALPQRPPLHTVTSTPVERSAPRLFPPAPFFNPHTHFTRVQAYLLGDYGWDIDTGGITGGIIGFVGGYGLVMDGILIEWWIDGTIKVC